VRGLLLINPRSGSARPSAEELEEEAGRRELETRLLEPGEDVAAIVRASDAEAIGMAGGDGSLAPAAAAAMAADRPFVCVPFGTRNHFARDIGLDRDDPVAALEAFRGRERRVDVGRVGERVFLNNVSLGIYASLVHHRERHRRRRDALARVRAIGLAATHRHEDEFVVEGRPVSSRAILVANNSYQLDLFNIGERERLDEGLLHLYVAQGLLPGTWEERRCTELEIGAPAASVRAAVDGEPVELEAPLRFRIEPRALRVLLPPGLED
jgi:diacylglycerol kinase family enzyme